MSKKELTAQEKEDLEVKKTMDVFWPKPARDVQAEYWRNEHKKSLALLIQGGEPSYNERVVFNKLQRMVKNLVHKDGHAWNGNVLQADPEDQRFVNQTLGRLYAQRWSKEKQKSEGRPPMYTLNELFRHWTARACEGIISTQPNSGDIHWKTRVKSSEQSYQHWSQDLISQACGTFKHHGPEMDIYRSWTSLRGDMEAFLEGWRETVENQQKDIDSPANGAQKNLAFVAHTQIGLCCLAMRTMATIIPRRIPPNTADILWSMEKWTGPGGYLVPDYAMSGQRAVWDRYLLERNLRDVRIPREKSKKENETHGGVRRRKM